MLPFSALPRVTALALTDQFVAGRPAALERFRARWAASGREPLIGTSADLPELQDWFMRTAARNEADGRDDLPIWWGDDGFPVVDYFGVEQPETPQYVRLVDDVAAQIEHILAGQVPRAYWACQPHRPYDKLFQMPVLVIGDPEWPPQPAWNHVYITGLRALRNPVDPLMKTGHTPWSKKAEDQVDQAWQWWEREGGVRRTEWSRG
ncbi:hypothetical protein [Cellulomonas sp.]|uniref:hypothetical protein n=1 Tax=Cellulomonas sp. TaxID=40001 RepID=UPI003BAAE7CB